MQRYAINALRAHAAAAMRARPSAYARPLSTSRFAAAGGAVTKTPGETQTDADAPAPAPTHESRLTPHTPTQPDHPGYTRGDEPPSSKPPVDMPPPPAGAKPSGMHTNASTKAAPPHPGVHTQATGSERHGSDALTPEERTQQNWGPNSRSQQFNPVEMKRQPVHHEDGSSNVAPAKKDHDKKEHKKDHDKKEKEKKEKDHDKKEKEKKKKKHDD